MAHHLKAFSAGINTHVSNEVMDMLDQLSWTRQSHVLIVAPTKTAAIEFVDGLATNYVGRPTASDVRVSTSNDTEALRAAGLLGEPAVFVSPTTGGRGDGVVRIDADGFAKLIGRLVRENGTVEFEPIGTVTVKLRPEQVDALNSLLDLVHYDDLAQSWRDMLPAELLRDR